MNTGRVMHGSHNGVQVLRYIGDIRYTLSLALDAYIKGLLRIPDLRGFVVDLSAVDGIDTTNLGILARLARAMQRSGLPKVTVVSDRPVINEILEGMGFDRVFHVVSGSGSALERMREIPDISSDDTAMTRLLLESHRALLDMNERNRVQFKNVVEVFEAAMARRSD